MTRFAVVLAALSLSITAFAAPDDDEDEFDLLSDDAPEVAIPDQVIGAGDAPEEEAADPDMDVESGVPAPPADEPAEDFLGNVDGDPDEDFMPDFNEDRKKASRPATQGPGPIALDVAGKEPFADNYPLNVVSVDRDAVVVELPVLIGRSRVGFEQPFVISGEVSVGGTQVSTVRMDIGEQSLADFGPSFVFLKVLVPVADKGGEITLTVKKDDVELFARSVPYSL